MIKKDTFVNIVLFLGCIILIFVSLKNANNKYKNMADPVWGNLEKAQDDDQTIAQAIAAAVAAHEADSDAHAGSGESLETHKGQEIVDHPMGSIVGDKFTGIDVIINALFESFDEYNVSVGGLFSNINGFRFETGIAVDTVKHLYAAGQYAPKHYGIDVDTTFQFYMQVGTVSGNTVYAVAGGSGEVSEPPGIGFKVVNGTLYAVEAVYGEEAFEEYTTEISGIDVTDAHLYRVQVIDADGKAYFYVDGVLKAELTLHVNADSGLMSFSFEIKNTLQGGNRTLEIGGVYLSLKV